MLRFKFKSEQTLQNEPLQNYHCTYQSELSCMRDEYQMLQAFHSLKMAVKFLLQNHQHQSQLLISSFLAALSDDV